MSGRLQRSNRGEDTRSDHWDQSSYRVEMDHTSESESQASGPRNLDEWGWESLLSSSPDCSRHARDLSRLHRSGECSDCDRFTESSRLPQGETARRETEAASQVQAQGLGEETEEEDGSSYGIFGLMIVVGAVAICILWKILS